MPLPTPRSHRPSPQCTSTHPTEEQLQAWMVAALDGDSARYAALLRAVRPLLLNYFSRRIGSGGSDHEDLAQEVIIAIHERRASYDRNRPFAPWLFAVARHKLIDFYRRSRRHQPIEPLESILVSEGFADRVDARLDVEALLATLPAKQSAAIRLTRLLEMSVADAAARVGIGQSDVKVSSHRGIRALAARVAS